MQIPKELGRGWDICYVNWGCVRGGAEMSSVGDMPGKCGPSENPPEEEP